MQSIGARTGDQLHRAARIAAIFGLRAVSDDPEFLHGICIGRIQGQTQTWRHGVVHVDAVQGIVIGSLPHAVHPGETGVIRTSSQLYARLVSRQRNRIAGQLRQSVDVAQSNRALDGRLRSLNAHRAALHHDRVTYATQFQLDVLAQDHADIHFKVVHRGLPESGRLGRECVHPRLQRREKEESLGIRLPLKMNPRADVDDGKFGAGNDGTGSILNSPLNAGVLDLRKQQRQNKAAGQRYVKQTSHTASQQIRMDVG